MNCMTSLLSQEIKTSRHDWKGSQTYSYLCIYWVWRSSQSLVHLPPKEAYMALLIIVIIIITRLLSSKVGTQHHNRSTKYLEQMESWCALHRSTRRGRHLTPHFCIRSTEFYSWKSWNISDLLVFQLRQSRLGKVNSSSRGSLGPATIRS